MLIEFFHLLTNQVADQNCYFACFFPNPSNGNFTLAIQSEKASEVTVLISNLIGQQMKEFNQHLNAGLNAISVQNLQLPDGKYLVNIISNDGRLNNPVTFNIKN